MTSLYGLTYSELENELVSHGVRAGNAAGIFSALYRQGAEKISDISVPGAKCRSVLDTCFTLTRPVIKERQISADGTEKLLFELGDSALVESVLMRYGYGAGLCVSSEVGCSMGCAFCASGLLKRQRVCTADEMTGQVMAADALLRRTGEKLTHVVIMGTGEPFDNYDNVLRFMRIVNDDRGLAIASRHITVSTCGLVPGILRFAEEPEPYNLAISLHAPTDEKRSALMPVNRTYDISALFGALDKYWQNHNRRVTFEYILLDGVNDSPEDARLLAELLRGRKAYVNLIPFNTVSEKGFQPSSYEKALEFYDGVMKGGVKATLRTRRGGDIDAACGQLRAKRMKSDKA